MVLYNIYSYNISFYDLGLKFDKIVLVVWKGSRRRESRFLFKLIIKIDKLRNSKINIVFSNVKINSRSNS